MTNWLKRIFKKTVVKGAADNKYYIEKYKDFGKIIATKYQMKDSSGKTIDIDGIVNPLKIDNRQTFAVIDDQGSTCHCAGYSVCGVVESLIWKRTGKLVNLNADQVYAKAKQIDGDINSDGTYLECAFKAALELGGLGKYSGDVKLGFLYNNQPIDVLKQQVKYLLHKYDFLEAGFMITDGWYNAGPSTKYKVCHGRHEYGGHAVVIVGADEECAYIANSWGRSWCAKGFCMLPWDVFKKEFMYVCYLQNCFNDWHE